MASAINFKKLNGCGLRGHRILKAARHESRAFPADMRGLGQVEVRLQGTPVFLQSLPAALTVKVLFAERAYRTNLNTLAALVTCFEKARFLGLYDGRVLQFSLGHKAPQPA